MSGRAGKAGDAYRLEQKMLERYDQEEALGTPQRLIEWINKTLEGEEKQCCGHSHKELQEHFKSGVVLCKLINKLLASDGQDTVKFKANATMAFAAMENIGKFTKGAENYGVASTNLFETADLYEGRKAPFLNVINCLNTLGFKANSKGFQTKYEAVEAPKTDY